jgi:hypothetical protein
MLKGVPSRIGYNTLPALTSGGVDAINSGPGVANLRWWTPNSTDNRYVLPLIVDNTDYFYSAANPNPYSNTGGISTSVPVVPTVGTGINGWQPDPLSLGINNIDANDPWLEQIPNSPNEREPAYMYAPCVASAVGNNYVPVTGGVLRTWTWNFTAPAGEPNQYALYVWIPVGNQQLSGTTTGWQRYFPYTVQSGGNVIFSDIVDTNLSGGGWVRIGNGGAPTSMVFPYDGTNQLSVTLYNTVPRDSNGILTEPVTGTADSKIYVVYADAAEAVPTNGYYDASPVSAQLINNVGISQGTNTTRTVAALNQFSTQVTGVGASATVSTYTTGTVTSYNYATGVPIWTYTPLEAGANPYVVDVNLGNISGPSAVNGGFGPTPTGVPHKGLNPQWAPISVAALTAPGGVTYNTNLNSGNYFIYAYVPGSAAISAAVGTTVTLGKQVSYTISGGGITNTILVNQDTAAGWVQIGTSSFANSAAFPLTVTITNAPTSATSTDIGSYAYTDEVQFVGATSQAISSTPLIATVNIEHLVAGTGGTTGVPAQYQAVLTQVVIVPDENGYIHCLDAVGNADGTTQEYWTYPTIVQSGQTDPNLGSNGPDVGVEMPTGFNLSSAVILPFNVGTVAKPYMKYYLYIGTTNGRVYCIDTAGRADFTAAAPGSTMRIWSYPSPSITTSKLGAFRGSIGTNLQISYSTALTNQEFPTGTTYPVASVPTVNGTTANPAIYVPTTQGRLLALDPLGTAATTSGTGTTTVLWQFPSPNAAPLGPIWTTPVWAFGNVYFGTATNPTNDAGGIFYSLNATNIPGTGVPSTNWYWDGSASFTDAITQTTVNVPDGDFLSSPAVVPFNVLYNGANPPTGVTSTGTTTDGIVYAMNNNGYLFAFEANPAGNQPILEWAPTNELATQAIGGISFTFMTVYTQGGTLTAQTPVVVVPTLAGQYDALFADPNTDNADFTRLAWFYITTAADIASTVAISNTWMYGTDEAGFLDAFNNATGTVSGGTPPGSEGITENNPAGAPFRHPSLKLLTQAGYNLLRQPTGQNLDYYTATGNKYSFTRTPLAFEWGETAYILVYNFPYLTSNGTNTVAPPVVNLTLSSQGKTVRTISVESRLFNSPPNAPDDPYDPNYPNGTEYDNGYAILAFPLQAGGNQSLPPGGGTISVTISTSALNSFGAQQTVMTNRQSSMIPFSIANPIALSMPSYTNPLVPGPDAISIGLSVSPSNLENLVNGSPQIPGDGSKNTALLGASAGIGQHGGSITTPVYVYDRSMMGLQRPDGTGLDGVRVDVRNLAWQGGHLAIYKPLPSYYANFEDYPDNQPNTSIDYPDIQTQQVQVAANPNGTTTNPRFSSISLIPPLVKDPNTGVLRSMQLGDTPETRVLQPTQFNMTVNIPRFQPANTNFQANAGNALVPDSSGTGTFLNQGYLGRVRVFVDSNQNGLLDTSPAESYRSFNLMNSVDVDEKLTVSTPTVNLGTLAEGTGYDPLAPGTPQGYNPGGSNNNAIFQPWGGIYSSLFQTVVVNNEGNVNLLDVRLAKGYQIAQGNPPVIPSQPLPWALLATANDNLGYLDGFTDLWSDVDAMFAPEAIPGVASSRQVISQKARVTDVSPTQVTANPVRRANANLGTTGTFTPIGQTIPLPDVQNQTLTGSTGNASLLYPPVSPRVAVSVPIGMPAGAYSQQMRFIEKNSANEIWQMFNGAVETYSDPTFFLNFNVRETQLTNTYTKFTAPMLDSLTPPSSANPLSYSSIQPAMVRDPSGSLIVAFASDRQGWAPTTPTSTSQLGAFSLYLGALKNTASFSNFGVSGTQDPSSPLGDLNSMSPVSNGQWFSQQAAGYPSQSADVLFGSQTGENVITGTVQYGNPSFPSSGYGDPFNPGSSFGGMFMAFTGSAQKQTPSGRLGENALFITTLSNSSGGNVGTPGQPIALLADPFVQKGKPSVLQTLGGADVFYTGVAGSQSSLYYSFFNGTAFGPSVVLPVGTGFQSVTGVSSSGRVYAGAGSVIPGTTTPIFSNGDKVVELTFTAKLQGRSNPEVFIGRLKLDPSTYKVVDDQGVAIDNPATDGYAFRDLPQRNNEQLVVGSNAGLFRSLGVQWDVNAPVSLSQMLNGTRTNLLIAGTGKFDRETGIISYDSALGGKVFIDTTLGTVRFGTTIPASGAAIFASYSPRFLRVSAGANGYSKPTGLFDHREISNAMYWRQANGAFATFNNDIKSDRLVFTYNQGASGSGAPARPYISSLRFGVQLTYRVATDVNGNPLGVSVTGNVGPYQIDPANGRIYLTGVDENSTITVSYTALAENNTTGPAQEQWPVTLVQELSEQQVLIDNAVNESDLTTFLDPFSYFAASQRRPPLMWLFWTSARAGAPNVFFETLSPQWSPIAIGQ